MLRIQSLCLTKENKGKKFPILRDLSLDMPEQKITLLLGKSGSGKTSVLRCIAQLEKQYTGQIEVEGMAIRDMSADRRCQVVGFVPQSYSLFPFMHVLDNCAHPLMTVLGISKEEAYRKVKSLLDTFGMNHLIHSFPHELSGGQQQRTAIIRALALNPKFLLLDEPTSALDPENTELLIQIMNKLASEGRGIVVSSQDMHFAAQVFERVFFLEDGQIVEHHDSSQHELDEESRLNRFVFSKKPLMV